MNSKNILLSIIGPTASGKSDLALKLASYFKTRIISADSRQFYRELNIGTAKPSAAALKKVPHHFINSHSILEEFNVGDFEKSVIDLLNKFFRQYNILIMVGGSGLYCKAVWEGLDKFPIIDTDLRSAINEEVSENGLDPLLAELSKSDPIYFNQVDQQNPARIKRAIEVIRSTNEPFSSFHGKAKTVRLFENLKIGISLDRKVLYDKIDSRIEQMIKNGLFEEVKSLIPNRHLNALQTLGYTEIFDHYKGKYDKEETIRLLKRNSRRYAKRQLTWFQKDDDINWLDPNKDWERILEQIHHQLNA
tara:strand:+ start:1885 stop:2799 length:915 start_codon:yes stop_codon:yes gene_type:complete